MTSAIACTTSSANTLAQLPKKADSRASAQTSRRLWGGDLQKFLTPHRVKRGEPYNVTSMGAPHGSYMVPDDHRPNFYRLFANSVEANILPALIERPGAAGPVVIDIDLRFDPSTFGGRVYTLGTVKEVAAAYMDCLGEYVELTEDNSQIYVLERPGPYLTDNGGAVKDGFHLVLPGIRCCAQLKHLAREHALKACSSTFAALSPTNPMEDILDEAVIQKNGWFMHGGAKPGLQPYGLTHVLDAQLQEIAGGIDRPSISLLPLLANSGEVENVTYVKELPEIQAEASKKLPAASRSRPAGPVGSSRHAGQSDIKYATELVPLLSSARAGNEEAWMQVGWCLHNICAEELLPAWIGFSKQSGKFEEGECESRWAAMKPGELHMGSLIRWAQEDSPALFQGLLARRQATIDQYMEEAITHGGQHVDTARVFCAMYPNKYRWAATKGTAIFFTFNGHTWELLDNDAEIFSLLCGDVSAAFRCKAASYTAQFDSTADLGKKEAIEKKRTMAIKIANKLLDTGYVSKAQVATSKLLHSKDFLTKLDTNLDLLAFEDGVYELLTGTFRPGQPCDMLSCSTSYDYPTSDPARRAALMEFLRQVVPKEEVLEYLLDSFSQCLSGRTRKQLFHIFAGALAGNGKSTLINLLALAFGRYHCSISSAYLTQKSAQANAPNPIVLTMKSARVVTTQEPEESSRFNSSLVKELVGGDLQTARTLFSSKLINYYPQFSLFAACNDAPEIQGKDNGLKRRIRMVGFDSQFREGVAEPDLLNNIYPINVDMGDLLKEWAPELMCMLLERYSPDYEYSCPPIILELSAAYMAENDKTQQFVAENLHRDPNSAITFAELRGLWSGPSMGLQAFKKDLARVLGTPA